MPQTTGDPSRDASSDNSPNADPSHEPPDSDRTAERASPDNAPLPSEVFDTVAATVDRDGPSAGLRRVADILTEHRRFARVFDALCLAGRFDMGLPLHAAHLAETIPPEKRRPYEDYVIGVCRHVADLFLGAGDLAGAYNYLKTLGETSAITAALEAMPELPDDSRADNLIALAWQEGVAPQRGFAWILQRYGTCQAITALESDTRWDRPTRQALVGQLVARLHGDLTKALCIDIQSREGAQPPPAPIGLLVMGRPWLFDQGAYHLDNSHLSAGVRAALILDDAPSLGLAIELCDYGQNLSADWQTAGQPPFDDLYRDSGLYLRAVLGQSPPDEAIEHFAAKARVAIADPAAHDHAGPYCAQVAVHLAYRLARYQTALTLFDELHPDADGPPTACASYGELCRAAHRPDLWATHARKHDDLVSFAAALAGSKQAPVGSRPSPSGG